MSMSISDIRRFEALERLVAEQRERLDALEARLDRNGAAQPVTARARRNAEHGERRSQ